MLGGFGNLRGKLEVWDVKGTKMISQFDVPVCDSKILILFLYVVKYIYDLGFDSLTMVP